MKLTNTNILLALLFFAFILRIFGINHNPPSLNWDEISHGYNAYSILQTGHDEWGVRFPSIFRAYGDYKLPVYIYVTAISEFFFGLTSLAVRLPSVLAGVGLVLFTYLLVLELFKSFKLKDLKVSNIALLSALLVAVEPWSLFLSRGAFEANLSQFFIVSGIYFFIKSRSNSKYFLMSILLLGLSVWTYNSARVFVPLLLAIMTFLYRKELRITLTHKRGLVFTSLTILLLFFVPMFVQLGGMSGQARYSKVSIVDQGAVNRIIDNRQNYDNSPVVGRILYNRATYFAEHFIKNYFSHFSPKFLFAEGGSQHQFSIPKIGILYIINLPFIVIGFLLLIGYLARRDSDQDKWFAKLILAWILIAPIPSSVTREAPHVLRAITFLPLPMILSAFGVSWFVNYVSKRNSKSFLSNLLFLIYITAILVQTCSYISNYSTNYRNNFSSSWQYGMSEVVEYVKQNYNNYDRFIITKRYGEPHEFFLFHLKYEPDSYINNSNLIRFAQSDWYWVDRFDKFYFVNDWEVTKLSTIDPMKFVLESKSEVECSSGVRCLLVTSPGNVADGWTLLKTVQFLDGSSAFEIYEN